jgi:AcrR family transcriptional regulator
MAPAKPRAVAASDQAPAVNLDARAWIEAATDALAEGGIDAVRIDRLAKKLGVTRGSFYWHFKDHDALLQALLKDWRARATYQLRERIERPNAPAGVWLKELLALPYSSPRSARGAAVELAIRLWARREPRAARVVRVIDRTRLSYFAALLEQHGLSAKDARSRAMMFYAFLMAEAIIVVDKKDEDLFEACERLLLKVDT